MTCPDDGRLLRYLDERDELAGEAAGDVAAHVARCADCAARLRAIETHATDVRGWLQRHDAVVPDLTLAPAATRGGSRRRWATAAGVLLAAAVVAGPARAWIRTTFGEEAPPEVTVAPESDATTRFHVRGSELTVRFSSVTPELALWIAASDDSLASLEAPSAEGEIVVAPGSVEVRDPPSTGVYRLVVPRGVRTVLIERPGFRDSIFPVLGDVTIEVPLDPGPPGR